MNFNCRAYYLFSMVIHHLTSISVFSVFSVFSVADAFWFLTFIGGYTGPGFLLSLLIGDDMRFAYHLGPAIDLGLEEF